MQVFFESDEYGRLICTLSNGEARTAIAAADAAQAGADLLAAIDGVAADGCGECYWPQPAGSYRWLLRRDGERLRVAILWMTGVLTGWEHVYQGECDFEDFARDVRSEIRRFQAAGA